MIDLTALRQAASDVVDQFTGPEIYHLAVDFAMMSTPIQSLTRAKSLTPAPGTLDLKILASAISRVDLMKEASRKELAVSQLLLTWLSNAAPGVDFGFGLAQTAP